jgi:hypothetical protein
MELHHLHVAQREPARSAIARPSQLLSPEGVWKRYMVGPPPVARSTLFACTKTSSPVAHVDHGHARERAVGRLRRARPRGSPPAGPPPATHTCSASRLMISMPVRSPLCTVRSKVWPANAFWWMVPSGLRSKKAAQLVLELAHALDPPW